MIGKLLTGFGQVLHCFGHNENMPTCKYAMPDTPSLLVISILIALILQDTAYAPFSVPPLCNTY